MSRPFLLLFAAFLPDASLPSSSLSAAFLACPPLRVRGGFPPISFLHLWCINAGKESCPRLLLFEPAVRLLITKLFPSPRFVSNYSAFPQFFRLEKKKRNEKSIATRKKKNQSGAPIVGTGHHVLVAGAYG